VQYKKTRILQQDAGFFVWWCDVTGMSSGNLVNDFLWPPAQADESDILDTRMRGQGCILFKASARDRQKTASDMPIDRQTT
jgi:hypothetical protein